MSVTPRARWQIVVALALLGLGVWLAIQPGRAPVVGDNFGYTPNPEGVAEFLAELGEQRFFRQAAPEAMAKAERVDTFLYRAMAKAHQARYGKPWVCEKQGIGDCVAWGAMHAVWCSESISWDLKLVPEPPMMPSVEAIYGGSRVEARNKPEGSGGWSDGSFGGAAAHWLRDWGVVYRQPFPDLGYDLTAYSSERCKQWGNWGAGGQGDKGRLDAIAKKHPARHVVAVRTWDECVAALTAGFPVTIASSQGFASRTDESGVLAPSGTWMHQMCLVGIRFAEKAPPGVRPVDACLVLNSWGTKWLTYAGKYPADQPDGSFWAERPVVDRILKQGDSYAIGDIKTGFAWRDIHNGRWLMPAPIDFLSSSGTTGTVSLSLAP
jgi:hypothetical protein